MVGQSIREKGFNGSRLINESQKQSIYPSLQKNEKMQSFRKFCYNPYSNVKRSPIYLNRRVALESLSNSGNMHGNLRTFDEKINSPFSKDSASVLPFKNTLQFRRANLHGVQNASNSSGNFNNSNPQYDPVADFSSQGYEENNRYNSSRTPSSHRKNSTRYSFQKKKTFYNPYLDTNQVPDTNQYQFYSQHYSKENSQHSTPSNGKETDFNGVEQGYESVAPFSNQYSYTHKDPHDDADVYNSQGNEPTGADGTHESHGDQPVETYVENGGYENGNNYQTNGEYQYNNGYEEPYVDPNMYGYQEPYVEPNTYGYQRPYVDPNTYGYQEPYVSPNTYDYQEPYVDPNAYGYPNSYVPATSYDPSRKNNHNRTGVYPNQYHGQKYYNASLYNGHPLHHQNKSANVYAPYENNYNRQSTSNTRRIPYEKSEEKFLDVMNDGNSSNNDRGSRSLVTSSKVQESNESYKKQNTSFLKNNLETNRYDLKEKNDVIKENSNLIRGRAEKNAVFLTLNDVNGKPLQIQLRALTKKSPNEASSCTSSSEATCSDENTEFRNSKSHGRRSRRRNREVVIEALIRHKNKSCPGRQCKHSCQKISCHNVCIRHNNHSKCHNNHSKKPFECMCDCKRINGDGQTYLISKENNTGGTQQIIVKREKSPVVNFKAPCACVPFDGSVRQKLTVEEITPSSCRCNDKLPTPNICPLVLSETNASHSLSNCCNQGDSKRHSLSKVGEKIFEVIPVFPYNIQQTNSQELPQYIVTTKNNCESYTKPQGWFPWFRRIRPVRAIHSRFMVKNIPRGAMRKISTHMV